MTCLACGQVHPDEREVTLHDGRVVSSYSEDWRHECEANAVLDLPTKNERSVFLSKIAQHRGKLAADALRETVTKLWNIRLAVRRAVG